MTSNDEYFPRGGFKPTANSDSSIKKPPRIKNLFGNVHEPKSKNRKRQFNDEYDIEDKSVKNFINKTGALRAVSADALSYKKIHEGMSILACIKQINTMTVNIELPGRCFAEILVQNISTGYSQLISEAIHQEEDSPSLENYVKIGEFIPVKILKIDNGDKLRIFASCNPSDVNLHFKHTDFNKNMLVWGAIKEKSDHGYLIDLGVKNCRAHLPFTDLSSDEDLPVGKILYMTVKKSVSSKEATTLTLSATREAFDKITERLTTTVDKTIPGMQVNFLTQKHLKDGLQGEYFDECAGFINDLYLQTPFDSTNSYKEFTTLKARLLYIHPVSKHGYFTLKSLHEPDDQNRLSIGDWVSAKIISKAGSGLVVKLHGGFKGFITFKRLLQMVSSKEKEEEDDFEALIALKFPLGTTRHCTVLDYNHTERLYICTFEQIKEVISVHQLKVGQVVKGTIKKINNHGLVVRLGKVDAFAPRDNLVNVKFSNNILKQFKIGQELTAKVWNINLEKRDVILTLKPELLKSKIHLTSYENLNLDEQYPGVVITISDTGVLVLFYAGVKGWLPIRNIPQLQQKVSDTQKEFYCGQVIKPRIAHFDNEELTLTLTRQNEKSIDAGTIITRPKIMKITEDGLYVKTEGLEAFVPKEQLAVEGLGKLFLPTYKVHDILDEELICVADANPPILSIRELVVYRRERLKTPAFKELKENVLMRAIIKDRQSIYVPLKGHQGDFQVRHKVVNVLPKYESITAKVVSAERDMVKWKLKLDDVFSYNYEETLTFLDQFLGDVERLRRRLGGPLVDLKVGATVDCEINHIDLHRGCSVVVKPMNCQGLVSLNDCPNGKLVKGSVVKGKVLWINYELKYAAITLNPKVIKKIGDVQGVEIDMRALKENLTNVEIVHANRNVAVAVLQPKFNRQLVYLPVKMHENDVSSKPNMYDEFLGNEVSVKVQKMPSGRLLGVTKSMWIEMGKKECGELIVLCKKGKKKLNKKVEDIKEEDEGIESSEDIKDEPEDEREDDKAEEVENGIEYVVMEEESENEETLSENEDSENEHEECESENIQESDNEDLINEDEYTNNEITQSKIQEIDIEDMNNDTNVESPHKRRKNKKRKLKETFQETTKKAKKTEDNTPAVLPGMSSFFDDDTPHPPKEESDDEAQPTIQKTKLTPAERLRKAKEEEARLRKIETELADSSILPQNAEQFDRALLGNPDDSELWTRYIAFHAQSTEFDKARGVAKRAIERISYTALQDRLNVWLAYLNLENMYGTRESFKTLFDEAARCNDALTIYLESIKMMAGMSKFSEMDELIKKARGKFKQELQMWLELGKVYFKCGKFADARKMKDRALLVLVDKKAQMQLIVQYAIMEFNFGESNQGEALFETILQADPKRVDIWSTYVDQLIKKGKIDLARNVLTRAVGQKLPYKKMRTLFKKYHNFETAHGDEETIAHVTTMLHEYSEQS